MNGDKGQAHDGFLRAEKDHCILFRYSIPGWYLAFPVVRQRDVVIWPANFPAVVHECVEVREVAVQVHAVGVVPPCQVPNAVRALQDKGASWG